MQFIMYLYVTEDQDSKDQTWYLLNLEFLI